jgi:hypothetical protein
MYLTYHTRKVILIVETRVLLRLMTVETLMALG